MFAEHHSLTTTATTNKQCELQTYTCHDCQIQPASQTCAIPNVLLTPRASQDASTISATEHCSDLMLSSAPAHTCEEVTCCTQHHRTQHRTGWVLRLSGACCALSQHCFSLPPSHPTKPVPGCIPPPTHPLAAMNITTTCFVHARTVLISATQQPQQQLSERPDPSCMHASTHTTAAVGQGHARGVWCVSSPYRRGLLLCTQTNSNICVSSLQHLAPLAHAARHAGAEALAGGLHHQEHLSSEAGEQKVSQKRRVLCVRRHTSKSRNCWPNTQPTQHHHTANAGS